MKLRGPYFKWLPMFKNEGIKILLLLSFGKYELTLVRPTMQIVFYPNGVRASPLRMDIERFMGMAKKSVGIMATTSLNVSAVLMKPARRQRRF